MKRNIAPRTLVVVLAATLIMSVSATAQVGGAACSAARAAGTYGVSDSGTVIGIGPRAAVAHLTLDASGNINGTVWASLNGLFTEATLSGTYTVKTGCTGETTFSETDQLGNQITATVVLVWDDNMRQLRFLFKSVTFNGNPLPTAVNGEARKLAVAGH